MHHQFLKILNWLKAFKLRRLYVIADPADNSVTLSKALWHHILKNTPCKDSAKVFVFAVPDNNVFGFILNPHLDRTTQIADLQYNAKYRSIGFESLCPSVNYIFYRYRLPVDTAVRLSVTVRHTGNGDMYYQLDRPSL